MVPFSTLTDYQKQEYDWDYLDDVFYEFCSSIRAPQLSEVRDYGEQRVYFDPGRVSYTGCVRWGTEVAYWRDENKYMEFNIPYDKSRFNSPV